MSSLPSKVVYLVVHGKTIREENPSCYLLFLNFDPPLSRRGSLAVKELALYLKNNRDKCSIILCSPFRACLDTASILSSILNVKVIVEKDLCDFFSPERHEFEYFVGLKPLQIKIDYPQILVPEGFPENWWPKWPEDKKDFLTRIYSVLHNAPNKAILVTHKTVVEEILSLSDKKYQLLTITFPSCFKIELRNLREMRILRTYIHEG